MSEKKTLDPAQLKLLCQVAAVVLALLAAWFGWSAWEQFRDSNRRVAVERARDAAVESAQALLAVEQKQFAAQLQSAPVQAALAANDLHLAGEALTQGWASATEGEVLSTDLDPAYAGLPKTGYGRLAAMEQALADQKPVAWVVTDGLGKQKLALAAPVLRGTELIGVASVRLPLDKLGSGIEGARIPEAGYLALRQGSTSLVERGDKALANGAEALAAKVPGSDLRVSAAVPDVAGGPLGLGWLPCAVITAILVLAALAAWLYPMRSLRRGTSAHHDDGDTQTLAQLAPDLLVPAAAVAVAAPAEAAPAARIGVAIDRGIFRAYDVRGVVGKTLDAGVAELLGQSIGSLMQQQGLLDIVVGRDGRLSGPELTEGLVKGLRKAGRNVIDIGMAPTPVVYFGAYQLRAGSCVSVTGSHNPPDYNGFKIVVGGETLSGDAITDLYDRIAEDRLYAAAAPGDVRTQDISEDYVQRIANDVQLDRPLKVVVDAGNGVAGEIGPRVLSAIGAEVTPLYCEIDGTFPNHHPDPSEPHNLNDLIRMVERLDADLGIAFDGDGDRLGVVTRDGQNIFPDRLLMLFAADVLERNPGAMIIFDVKCTGRLPGHILRHGGSPLMWKTGHSLIKAKMRETGAELAGEMSGHFFFKERWYGFDDGIYAAARLLEILSVQPDTPSATLAALPDGVSTPEIKVDAPDGDPHSFVERFRSAAQFEGGRASMIDGLRVDFADGWGLVRASNTTPVLVMRFDADSPAALQRIQQAFREQLLALKPDLVVPF
ncbi:phosphomannomutase/phosphoglucomutase [Lysobacter solisilvae (ex Woo and Kim 2020)]|uniref:phosphomannomutase n=1 Tax=Agrilutibacter terrestris TaxID=2865112 RepID=A0A7H0G0M6_9GAMM|nr:phosphomannomutase/phosphoglucomutase [Lysobacter terrestris]QNP41842.1 phosphomannomutase/phosphoglucomutase [Lysobacter terrestris]